MFEISMLQLLLGFEIFLVCVVLGVVMTLRSARLSRQVKELLARKPVVEKVVEDADAIDYEAYLRDEIIKTKGFLDAYEEQPEEVPDWLQARHHFLELELEAHALEEESSVFKDRLSAGFDELIERYRPAPVEAPAESDPAPKAAERLDNSEEEKANLRNLISHQQDAMKKLREQLDLQDNESVDLSAVNAQLDAFESQALELTRCIEVLEQENERLHQQSGKGESGDDSSGTEELDRLRGMLDQQQSTIGKLQSTLETLAPEDSRSKDLDAVIDDVLNSNRELNTCVKVLEDENASLHEQLLKAAAGDAGDVELSSEPVGDGGDWETRIQELEALLEFKDATIVQLENDLKDVLASSGAGSAAKAAGDDGASQKKIQELESLLEFKDATVEQLEADIATLRKGDAAGGGDDTLQKKVDELSSLLEFKDATVEQLEADIATLRKGDAAGGGGDALQKKVDELSSLLEFKDATLEQLEQDLTQARAGGASDEATDIKVQELEALLEFKDAAIEELEKQHAKLESRYLELSSGGKSAG